MEGFYRIAAATPRLHLGDPASNVKELVRLAKDAAKDGVSAIVFPELCLTGYTCGDMFFRDELLTAANAATETYAMKTANLPIVSIVGLPVAEGPAIYNAAAIVHGGNARCRTTANTTSAGSSRRRPPTNLFTSLTLEDSGSVLRYAKIFGRPFRRVR